MMFLVDSLTILFDVLLSWIFIAWLLVPWQDKFTRKGLKHMWGYLKYFFCSWFLVLSAFLYFQDDALKFFFSQVDWAWLVSIQEVVAEKNHEWTTYIVSMCTSQNISFLIACFVTVTLFVYLLLIRPDMLFNQVWFYLSILVSISFSFIFNKSLMTLFMLFECLLLVALGLLKLTSKSERINEAVSEMFMW